MYSCVIISAKDLWENVTHIMTDSMVQNLKKIENLVAEKIGSKLIPYHLTA